MDSSPKTNLIVRQIATVTISCGLWSIYWIHQNRNRCILPWVILNHRRQCMIS